MSTVVNSVVAFQLTLPVQGSDPGPTAQIRPLSFTVGAVLGVPLALARRSELERLQMRVLRALARRVGEARVVDRAQRGVEATRDLALQNAFDTRRQGQHPVEPIGESPEVR